jgi:hypothetical protein
MIYEYALDDLHCFLNGDNIERLRGDPDQFSIIPSGQFWRNSTSSHIMNLEYTGRKIQEELAATCWRIMTFTFENDHFQCRIDIGDLLFRLKGPGCMGVPAADIIRAVEIQTEDADLLYRFDLVQAYLQVFLLMKRTLHINVRVSRARHLLSAFDAFTGSSPSITELVSQLFLPLNRLSCAGHTTTIEISKEPRFRFSHTMSLEQPAVRLTWEEFSAKVLERKLQEI